MTVSHASPTPAAQAQAEDPVIARLAKFPSTVVSDALDDLGICGALPDLQAVDIRQGRVVGRAFTAEFMRRDSSPDSVRRGGNVGAPLEHVLREMRSGEVVVMDLKGSRTASAWGGLASQIAREKGVKGTVLYGTCRDLLEILEHKYPLWSVGVHPRRSRNEFGFGAVRGDITIGKTRIQDGDIIVADDSGVVSVPASLAEQVAGRCEEIALSEQRATAAIQSDLSRLDWDKV
jgi:regulator of RNase E activity RraA